MRERFLAKGRGRGRGRFFVPARQAVPELVEGTKNHPQSLVKRFPEYTVALNIFLEGFLPMEGSMLSIS